MRKITALSMILLPVLAACTPPPPPLEPQVVVSSCDPADYDDIIGQNEEIFARSTFPAPMRIIRPGMAVTTDFVADRLNFTVNNSGTVVQVYCG